jgi:hypothetical protein
MPKNNNKYLEQRINTRFSTFLDSINFGRMEFLDGVAERMARLKSSGLSEDAIVKTLYKEMLSTDGGTLAKLEKSEANDLWDFMKGASQDTVFAELDEEAQYRWVVNPGAQHCKGCIDRNGQIKTLEEWYAIGVPGSGDTDCYYNCMCDLVEVKEKPFSTRIKGRDIKGLDADIEARNNWKKAVADAKNSNISQADFNYDNKESSAKLRELPLESKDIKLLKEKFKDISFVETGYLPDKLQKGFCDEFNDLDDKLGANFTHQLGKVSVQELSPRQKLYSFATYEYDEQNQKGIIKINKNKYGLDVDVKPEYLNKFKSTIRHESGHHLYQIHNLGKRVEEFYYKNNIYIHQNSNREYWKRIKNPKEFFAESFDRFCNGTLTEASKDSKVYYFIKKIYEELRIKK